MTDNAIIAGEYVTFKHVKTRKVVVLEVEVPEEHFQDVIAKLGMPIGGESKPVAVCLLQEPRYNKNSNATTKIATEKSEGEKLLQRACILCGEYDFHHFLGLRMENVNLRREELATKHIYMVCNISSRKELVTNKEAQETFRELDRAYIEWGKPSVDEQYQDNLTK